MFGIGKLLFGEKVKIKTDSLGVFVARVKNVNQKDIIWTGKIESKQHELILLLLGGSSGPYKHQLEATIHIIDELDNIKNQIVQLINNDSELKDKFQNQNISDFHLACINPWLKNETSYELSFDSTKNDKYVGAIFKNGIVSDVNV